MQQHLSTDVLIVGGGPAGLMLAIELGVRNVNCALLEEDANAPDFPKANATSARTMEHYRRRGFAHQVRQTGMGADFAQDIVYVTRYAEHELARFKIPSRNEVLQGTAVGDYGEEAWPTPELPHRGQQMYIERILRDEVKRYPSVRLMEGVRANELLLNQTLGGGSVVVSDHQHINARFVVGCDGPRSMVRKTLQISYSGHSGEKRDFFGGQMMSLYFKAPTLYKALDKPSAWMYVAVNGVQRGLLISINGADEFMFAFQLRDDQDTRTVDHEAALFKAVGKSFPYELIAKAPWQAGHALVADKFQVGPVFLAGDATHLFTPTGGMGYNTSVDDAVNLGWKLAAVIQGFGGDQLLASYEQERRPIALRNTAFSRAMAQSIGTLKVPPEWDDDTAAGRAARAVMGDLCSAHVRREFNIPGLALGLRYGESSVIGAEVLAPPADSHNAFTPSAYAGCRAPHFWLDAAKTQSLFDALGRDFTLLCFKNDLSVIQNWTSAAQTLGVPLSILELNHPEGRTLYESDWVLIRPDHHVAWRFGCGLGADASPEGLLRQACGLIDQRNPKFPSIGGVAGAA